MELPSNAGARLTSSTWREALLHTVRCPSMPDTLIASTLIVARLW